VALVVLFIFAVIAVLFFRKSLNLLSAKRLPKSPQQNPNLDQGPTTDHADKEKPITARDVAALSQTPDKLVVTQGDHVTIQVVVENQGMQSESFDVICYFDTSIVGTLHVTNLPAGHSTTLNFVWNTAGVPPGTYAIRA